MRAFGRPPFPKLDMLLSESNQLLERARLPRCDRLEPVDDGDTANPNARGFANGRHYAIKICYRHPSLLSRQREIANEIRARTNLPIPEHLCCTDTDSPFPLMIMDWMPGTQLRLALDQVDGDKLPDLYRSLGECLGAFHDPDLMPIIEEEFRPAGAAEWWRRRVEQVLESAAGKALTCEIPRAAIEEYHWNHLRAVREAAAPSLIKADQDMRDFLVDTDRRAISAMLDWERVTRGDAAMEVAVIYMRMYLQDRMRAWPAFRQGYESTGRTIAASPQLDFLLFSRAILATQRNPAAVRLIREMIAGNQPKI